MWWKIPLGILGVVVMFGYAGAQIIAAAQGINYHWGFWWAAIIVFVCLAFKAVLPFTIAAFFGAKDAWGWHWALALLFAAPGLIFMLPMVAANVIGWLAQFTPAAKREQREQRAREAEHVREMFARWKAEGPSDYTACYACGLPSKIADREISCSKCGTELPTTRRARGETPIPP